MFGYNLCRLNNRQQDQNAGYSRVATPGPEVSRGPITISDTSGQRSSTTGVAFDWQGMTSY